MTMYTTPEKYESNQNITDSSHEIIKPIETIFSEKDLIQQGNEIEKVSTLAEIMQKVEGPKNGEIKYSDETIKAIRYLRKYLDSATNDETGARIGRAVGNICMLQMCLNYQRVKEGVITKAESVKFSNRILKGLFGGKPERERALLEQGFLAETCTMIGPSNNGFKAVSGNERDDLEGKVDVWADPNDGENMFAIQVKSDQDGKELIIKNSREIASSKAFEEFAEKATVMIKYTSIANESRKMLHGKRIIPVFIIIPGGESNENSFYNFQTGEPTLEFEQILYDNLDSMY